MRIEGLLRAARAFFELPLAQKLDTLEPSYEDWFATPAKPSAVEWLATEKDTLLRAARRRRD